MSIGSEPQNSPFSPASAPGPNPDLNNGPKLRIRDRLIRENRLPVDHPEFRYPPSKNPYQDKLKALREQGITSALTCDETETLQGKWRHYLGLPEEAELHVEIGCNGGHVILEWAKQQPQKAFVGVDWKFKQIFRAHEKAQKKNLRNITFLRAHAARLEYIFGAGEIDRLSLYFPDPWPRKSQWKNRTVTPTWLTQVAGLMRPKGILHIKTDHQGYFDWMSDAVKRQKAWSVVEKTRNLHANVSDPSQLEIPEVTLFEKLFIRDGIKICSLVLERATLASGEVLAGEELAGDVEEAEGFND